MNEILVAFGVVTVCGFNFKLDDWPSRNSEKYWIEAGDFFLNWMMVSIVAAIIVVPVFLIIRPGTGSGKITMVMIVSGAILLANSYYLLYYQDIESQRAILRHYLDHPNHSDFPKWANRIGWLILIAGIFLSILS